LYRFVDFVELNPPSLKDGFVATNSLLGFAVLLVRAYADAFSTVDGLPRQFSALFGGGWTSADSLERIRRSFGPLLNRETLIVLYGSSVSSAALDLESKFSEVALGNVQLADFRNFAHGRHHWIAKHEATTGVLALFGDDEKNLAKRTLRLIPPEVPIAEIPIPLAGPAANVAALVAVLHLVGAAGEQQRIDPGRPGVPAFGRRIYGLRALKAKKKIPSYESIAMARKLNCDADRLHNREDAAFWLEAYHRFVSSLQSVTFGGIVLDYDGTLCDERDRFVGVRDEAADELTRLLQSEVPIGIATGRGNSVKKDLRKIIDKQYWDRLHIGYYNASEIGLLCDDRCPDLSSTESDSLKALADAVSTHPVISQLAICRARASQISVRPKSPASADLLWRLLQSLAQSYGIVALRSSHSIDLLHPNTSKRLLLWHLSSILPSGVEVMPLGDKGQWPGNDYDLLNAPYSLSVDEVSADPSTCWNLAPVGHKGVQATLDYLSWIHTDKAGFHMVLPCSVGSSP